MMDAPGIGPFCPNNACDVIDGAKLYREQQKNAQETPRNPPIVPYQVLDENPVDMPDHPEPDDDFDNEENPRVKEAMALWKRQNPDSTLKEQRHLLRAGRIERLPWLDLLDRLPPAYSWGDTEPASAHKGDIWVRTSVRPHQLFKHNGQRWMQVDKDQNTSYTQELSYIDYLISELDQGNYDSSWLTQDETQAIQERLNPSQQDAR